MVAQNAPLVFPHDFAVEVLFVQDAPGQIGELRRELVVALQDHRYGLGKVVLLVGLADGRIDVVAAQPVHSQPARLQAEVALEKDGVLAAYLQQGVHHVVRNIVAQVAGRNRAFVAPQLKLLAKPVAGNRLVDLAQNQRIVAVDTE